MIWLRSVPAPSPLRAICRLSSLKDVSGQVSLLDIRHPWWRQSSWICISCLLEPKCLSPTPQSLRQHKHPIQVQSHPLLILSSPNPPHPGFSDRGPPGAGLGARLPPPSSSAYQNPPLFNQPVQYPTHYLTQNMLLFLYFWGSFNVFLPLAGARNLK